MVELDFEHFKAVLLMALFGIIGGVLISTYNYYMITLGILFIILDVFVESYFLKKFDTRGSLLKTKKELIT